MGGGMIVLRRQFPRNLTNCAAAHSACVPAPAFPLKVTERSELEAARESEHLQTSVTL